MFGKKTDTELEMESFNKNHNNSNYVNMPQNNTAKSSAAAYDIPQSSNEYKTPPITKTPKAMEYMVVAVINIIIFILSIVYLFFVSQKSTSFFLCIFAFGAASLLFSAVRVIFLNILCKQETTATVVSLDWRQSSGKNKLPYAAPIYEYEINGKLYQTKSFVEYRHSIPSVGNAVRIKVDAKNPSRMIAQNENTRIEYVVSQVLIVLVGVIGLIANWIGG